jgi:hypothetical protein
MKHNRLRQVALPVVTTGVGGRLGCCSLQRPANLHCPPTSGVLHGDAVRLEGNVLRRVGIPIRLGLRRMNDGDGMSYFCSIILGCQLDGDGVGW